MIYTSNFSKAMLMLKASRLNKFKIKQLVGIVRITPKLSTDKIIFETLIAPDKKLLKGYKAREITEEQYTEAYIKKLESIGADTISSLYNNKVLLCYCKSNGFCHRHILRDWLASKGIESIEI